VGAVARQVLSPDLCAFGTAVRRDADALQVPAGLDERVHAALAALLADVTRYNELEPAVCLACRYEAHRIITPMFGILI
jgi:hypothetical protein